MLVLLSLSSESAYFAYSATFVINTCRSFRRKSVSESTATGPQVKVSRLICAVWLLVCPKITLFYGLVA